MKLCSEKNCKAVIIFSAGFNEESAEGAKLEKEIVKIVDKYGASLIGPNCIGVITNRYSGVFTQPTSNVSEKGIDIISGSGATVVFIMEAAIKLGLTFSNVFSVGNSAQLGVEEILEYLDENSINTKAIVLITSEQTGFKKWGYVTFDYNSPYSILSFTSQENGIFTIKINIYSLINHFTT